MLKWRVMCLKTSCSILNLTRRSHPIRKKLVSYLVTLVLSLSCALTQAANEENVSIRGGRSLVTQLLGAGEYDLQIVAYWYRPHLMKKQGAPVDWIGIEPAIVALHPISIVEKAPHPNAARLFIDFAISDEGQKIFVQRGRESAKPGLKPEGYPSHLKVFPSRVQLAGKLEEYTQRYRALFVR